MLLVVVCADTERQACRHALYHLEWIEAQGGVGQQNGAHHDGKGTVCTAGRQQQHGPILLSSTTTQPAVVVDCLTALTMQDIAAG